MLSHTTPMSDIDPCRTNPHISSLAGLVLSELTKRHVKHLRSNMRSEIKQHVIYSCSTTGPVKHIVWFMLIHDHHWSPLFIPHLICSSKHLQTSPNQHPNRIHPQHLCRAGQDTFHDQDINIKSIHQPLMRFTSIYQLNLVFSRNKT